MLGLVILASLSCTPPLDAPIVPYDELDEHLIPIKSPQPEYPSEAREKGHEGTVVVRVLVGTDGKVLDTEIQNSSGYKELDEAARDAAKRWVFTKPTKNDEPVKVWAAIPFNFILEK